MNGFTIYLGSSLYIECVDGMTMGVEVMRQSGKSGITPRFLVCPNNGWWVPLLRLGGGHRGEDEV